LEAAEDVIGQQGACLLRNIDVGDLERTLGIAVGEFREVLLHGRLGAEHPAIDLVDDDERGHEEEDRPTGDDRHERRLPPVEGL
jgi:hypothetical protein